MHDQTATYAPLFFQLNILKPLTPRLFNVARHPRIEHWQEALVVHTERLDHLGIVAGICHEIDLIGHIDCLVPAPKRQVSVGETVQAMVLNALGFVVKVIPIEPGCSPPHLNSRSPTPLSA